jgi:adenylylsulfate kinase-like enzyme
MTQPTTIIYLTGKPGVGKYTIAKELAANYGFIVCDNQLINNPIFELLNYDGYAKIPDFAWDTIARIRAEVLDFLANHTQNNYVLTNCLAETKEDREIYKKVEEMAKTRGSLFVPVQIQISKEEHLKRLTRPERRERWKSIDPSEAEDNGPLLCVSHPNLLSLNVSNLSSKDAADRIVNHVQIVFQTK